MRLPELATIWSSSATIVGAFCSHVFRMPIDVTLEDELWLVDRPDGTWLVQPILGRTPSGSIRVKLAAGGRVTVLAAGSRVRIES